MEYKTSNKRLSYSHCDLIALVCTETDSLSNCYCVSYHGHSAAAWIRAAWMSGCEQFEDLLYIGQ